MSVEIARLAVHRDRQVGQSPDRVRLQRDHELHARVGRHLMNPTADHRVTRVLLSEIRRTVDPRHARQRSELSPEDRKSTRLNSSHPSISYAVFCLKKKKRKT